MEQNKKSKGRPEGRPRFFSAAWTERKEERRLETRLSEIDLSIWRKRKVLNFIFAKIIVQIRFSNKSGTFLPL
jgi:hypothetical protein